MQARPGDTVRAKYDGHPFEGEARDDGEWVRYDDVAPYLPKTLTADDPEPPIGSVVIDREGSAWQRFEDGRWFEAASGDPWTLPMLTGEYGPLTLIHRGGTE